MTNFERSDPFDVAVSETVPPVFVQFIRFERTLHDLVDLRLQLLLPDEAFFDSDLPSSVRCSSNERLAPPPFVRSTDHVLVRQSNSVWFSFTIL